MKWIKASNPNDDELVLPEPDKYVIIKWNDTEIILGTRNDVIMLYEDGWETIEWLDESAEQGDWVGCEDRLPGKLEVVLGVKDDLISMAAWNTITDKNAEWFKKTFTHWQPLPQPPIQ